MLPNVFTFNPYGPSFTNKIESTPTKITKNASSRFMTPRQFRLASGTALVLAYLTLYCGNKYYKQLQKRKVEIAQQTKENIQQQNRTNRSFQYKLRRKQKQSYIEFQRLKTYGFIHQSKISSFISMDIIDTIIKYIERSALNCTFGRNIINLQKFRENIAYWTSPIWNFNGFECSAILYPNVIDKKYKENVGFVRTGFRINNIPFNIKNVVVTYSFYDYQRCLHYHGIETLTNNDINLVYLWVLNTTNAIEKQLENPVSIEYDCAFDVLQMTYYDGYRMDNKAYKINEKITYDIKFSALKRMFTCFEPTNDYFYETYSSNKFGCDDNWCLKFKRIDRNQIHGYVRLLGLPKNVNRIVVETKLIDPKDNRLVAEKKNRSFSYKNHTFLFWWCSVGTISRNDMKDTIHFKIYIAIKEAYDHDDNLIDSKQWVKFGIIQ